MIRDAFQSGDGGRSDGLWKQGLTGHHEGKLRIGCFQHGNACRHQPAQFGKAQDCRGLATAKLVEIFPLLGVDQRAGAGLGNRCDAFDRSVGQFRLDELRPGKRRDLLDRERSHRPKKYGIGHMSLVPLAQLRFPDLPARFA